MVVSIKHFGARTGVRTGVELLNSTCLDGLKMGVQWPYKIEFRLTPTV